MATLELPPRRNRRAAQEMTIQRNRSSLEILVQMGFPKQRAERALAATGDKGVQLASDWVVSFGIWAAASQILSGVAKAMWDQTAFSLCSNSSMLLSHVNDPTIDDKVARDYILYLCPVGQLQQEFFDFWQKSYQECGWNRAHNYFPHITLCSFFQAEDSLVSQLSHAIKKIAERVTNAPETVEFDYFSSTNFIGLFITESFAALLKQITTDFADEMRKSNVTVEPHRKQLHVSLAYQFPTEKKEKLESLARMINLKAPVRWDLRLYSRDRGKNNCQVRKVLYTHVPGAPDELEMCDGDFIYMNETELDASTDGWYLGTSWLTGCTGMFPGVYTERTAETETWTMHSSLTATSVAACHQLLLIGRAIGSREPPINSTELPRQGRSKNPGRSIPIVGTDLGLKADKNGPHLAHNGAISVPKAHTGRGITVVHGHQDDTSALYMNDHITSHSSAASARIANIQSMNSSMFVAPASGMDRRVAQPTALSAIPEGAVSQIVPASATSQSCGNSVSNNNKMAAAAASKSSAVAGKSVTVSSNNVSAQDASSGVAAGSRSAADAAARASSPKHSSRVPAIDGIVPLAVPSAAAASNKGPRQLYVVRHGERIDFTFGKDWVSNSFNSAGQYVRYDLNMPKSIPKRKGSPQDFSKDCPLTVQGHFQARLLGEAMREKEIVISHIYASPSLRCVETACSVLESLGITREINVEPGLFEWLGWYQLDVLKFMSLTELKDAGYGVNLAYNPIWPFAKYNVQETTEQFYERSYTVTKEILKRHENEGGNVLIVAHGLNLDSCTRQLVGQPPRSQAGFHEILHKIPYCAMSVVQEATVVRDTWYLIEPPVLPFAHTNNPKYNWTSLTTPGLV